uniref:Hormone-sensitive lipase n=1 Tax=Trichuris muris TaxID=70415 RepID=A0A5S6QQI0_TRIMR
MTRSICLLAEEATKFDYDLQTPGNGFRSILSLFDKLLLLIICTLHHFVALPRWDIFLSRHRVKLNLDAYTQVMKSFRDATSLVVNNIHLSVGNELFPPLNRRDEAERVMDLFEQLDQKAAFGRAVGFQFCRSVTLSFRVITAALAFFGAFWESPSLSLYRICLTLFSCSRFVFLDRRSEQVVRLYSFADVQLFRSFWSLLEVYPLRAIRELTGPRVPVNSLLTIPPYESYELRTKSGKLLKVTGSVAHTGLKPLRVRLVSSLQRHGLLGRNTPEVEVARSLVLHCHGGGFIATSTDTHEPYLRLLADQLGCPVVSIDYSLAPEAPYPRAVEEALFAYAWCLSNAAFLGWTGERICLVGESAGGLLLTSLCLKLIELNASRLPDGLVVAYAPFMFQFVPSASRLLSLYDPLIPWQITYRCMQAYIGGQGVTRDSQSLCLNNVKLVDDQSDDSDTVKAKPLTEPLQHRNERVHSRVVVVKGEKKLEMKSRDAMKTRLSTSAFDSDFLEFLSNSDCLKQSYQVVVDCGGYVIPKGDRRAAVDYVNIHSDRAVKTWLSILRVFSAYQTLFVHSLLQLVNGISIAACNVSQYILTWFRRVPKRNNEILGEPKVLKELFAELICRKKSMRSEDPFISPLLASDELLAEMPPVSILACHMDPLLDDSVSFAKRLREVKVPHTFDLLDLVPHGFMNFMSVSEECRSATLTCIERVESHLF